MTHHLRLRETSGLAPGQSRLRGRSRRHPSLATDAQAWARAVWTPCLPQPRPAMPEDAANLRLPLSSPDRLTHVGFDYARSPIGLRPRHARFSRPQLVGPPTRLLFGPFALG